MWLWLISPIGRKVAGTVAVVTLMAGVTLYIYNKGRENGRQDGQRDQLEQDRKSFEQDRKQFLDTLATYQAKDQAAQQQIQQQNATIAALASARVAARAAVDRLPDAQLGSDIHTKLGSPASDAPLTISELRRVDEILTDYGNLSQQVTALQAKSAEQDKRIDAIEHQRDAAIESYNKLVPLYTKAYNAAQKKHSLFVKIITFGLVRDRKIDLPAPATLEHP